MSEAAAMQLLIDAGNTRIKWALHDGRAHVASGACPTGEAATLTSLWPNLPEGTQAWASNVAGDAVAAQLEAACASRGVTLQLVKAVARQLGVTNGYADPSQLGSDRWAALIAAHKVVDGPKLVVNAGTALTVDALASSGQFMGGLIVPGPALMRQSLDRGTAGLKLTEGTYRDLPRSTPDAITTGAIQAAVGAVERMSRVMTRAGEPSPKVVLSGGAASEIAPHLPIAPTVHENLVLDGLALIARAR